MGCGASNAKQGQLIEAGKKGDLTAVKKAIEEGAKVNSRTRGGELVLCEAAACEKLDLVKWLVEDGKADVNLKNNSGYTALTLATTNEYEEIVGYLVAKSSLETIEAAMAEGMESMASNEIREILEKKLTIFGDSPQVSALNGLIWSTQLGYVVKVKEYLKKGADVNKKNSAGASALLKAVGFTNADDEKSKSAKLEIAKFLIEEAKADIEITNERGFNALMEAVDSESLEMVKLLLPHYKQNINGLKYIQAATNKAREEDLDDILAELM